MVLSSSLTETESESISARQSEVIGTSLPDFVLTSLARYVNIIGEMKAPTDNLFLGFAVYTEAASEARRFSALFKRGCRPANGEARGRGLERCSAVIGRRLSATDRERRRA